MTTKLAICRRATKLRFRGRLTRFKPIGRSASPFLELQSVSDRYFVDKLNIDSANRPARESYVRVYVCPADPTSHEPDEPSTGPGRTLAYRPSNYRAMTGRSDGSNFFEFVNYPFGVSPSAKILNPDWRGPMHVFMPSANLYWEKLGNIPDGTSNTIMVGEYFHIHGTSTPRYFWAYGLAVTPPAPPCPMAARSSPTSIAAQTRSTTRVSLRSRLGQLSCRRHRNQFRDV